MRTHYCGAVTAADIGNSVTLCGWAHRRRDHGGVIFIDLRDREGMMQVVIDPDTPEAFKLAEDVRSEFVLKIEGLVRPRPAGTENPNMPTGMVELLTKNLEVLNPSLTPPFQIDDDNINENIRLQYRYLDLRREPMQKNLQAALPRIQDHARLPRRARLHGSRNADADALHPGRRARLPGAEPRA